MKHARTIDPRKLGKPIEDVIRDELKNPTYRKHYMHYQVRTSLATVVKILREDRGMTQKQLADRAGVPQSQVARLEGLVDKRIPRLEHLIRIFDALDSHAYLEIVPRAAPRNQRKEIILV